MKMDATPWASYYPPGSSRIVGDHKLCRACENISDEAGETRTGTQPYTYRLPAPSCGNGFCPKELYVFGFFFYFQLIELDTELINFWPSFLTCKIKAL